MHLTLQGVPQSQQHPIKHIVFLRINHSLQPKFYQLSISIFTRAMAGKTPTWADQWDNNLDGQDDDDKNKKTIRSSGKKMAEVKAAASAGLDKAKVAATVGTQKFKSGTSTGMKWVKNQYQKFSK